MSGPREVPFHESANRPQLLMGGDRELILASAILAAMLVFAVALQRLWVKSVVPQFTGV